MTDLISFEEIAAALDITIRRAAQRAADENWTFVMKRVQGGPCKRFPATSLPIDVRIALCEAELKAQPAAPKPAVPAPVSASAGLTDQQRRVAEARAAILAEIDRLAQRSSVKLAVPALVEAARLGTLAPHLAALVPVANARGGEGGRTLSVPTLMRWRAARRDGGFAALAPRDGSGAPDDLPWWAEGFLRCWRLPSKPSIAAALDAFCRELRGETPPSYDQVRRLRQLRDLAAGGRCTEAEAVNAATIADRLMREHGITEEDIERSRFTSSSLPVPGGNVPKAMLSVCCVIAEHCAVVPIKNGDDIEYFGFEPDLVIAEYLHAVCIRAATQLLAEFRRTPAYRRRRKPASRAAASQAFVSGLAVSLRSKLAALGDRSASKAQRLKLATAEAGRRYRASTYKIPQKKAAKLDGIRTAGYDAGQSIDVRRAVNGGEPVARIGGPR
jgi:hypothetical protein